MPCPSCCRRLVLVSFLCLVFGSCIFACWCIPSALRWSYSTNCSTVRLALGQVLEAAVAPAKKTWRCPAANVSHRASMGTVLTRNCVDDVYRSGSVRSHKLVVARSRMGIYMMPRAPRSTCLLFLVVKLKHRIGAAPALQYGSAPSKAGPLEPCPFVYAPHCPNRPQPREK